MRIEIEELIKPPSGPVFDNRWNHKRFAGAGRTNGSSRMEGEFLPDFLQDLNAQFEGQHPDRVLEWGFREFGTKLVVGTGFGPSGVILIDRISRLGLGAPVFYLDTHLLFDETYTLRDRIEERFGIETVRVSTDLSLADQAREYGAELWKKDPDRCCYLRKGLPLKRYLSDKKAWVTGIRRSQSDTRKETQIVEWDPVNGVIKMNPLAGWTNDEVWSYIREHELPYNPLHDHGYPSIGCIPCTQPADPQRDERSGRWKDLDKTECGIHIPSQTFHNGNGKH